MQEHRQPLSRNVIASYDKGKFHFYTEENRSIQKDSWEVNSKYELTRE